MQKSKCKVKLFCLKLLKQDNGQKSCNNFNKL